MDDPYLVKTTRTKRIALWAIIGVGMLVRVLCIYYWSPRDAQASDSIRHLIEALQQDNLAFPSRVEPPIYGLWLGAFLIPFSASATTVFLYGSFMTVCMPLSWFLWMRCNFRDEFYSLIGLALFTFIPSLIGIYSFFQPETLLLPLVAISLWVGELYNNSPTFKRNFVVSLLWGLTITTRVTALPIWIAALVWSVAKQMRSTRRDKLIISVVMQLIIVASIYASVPIKIFRETGAVEFAPGTFNFAKLEYESGAHGIVVHVTYRDKSGQIISEEVPLSAPIVQEGKFSKNYLDEEYLGWVSIRSGQKDFAVDFTKPPPYYPPSTLAFKDRFSLWQENLFLLFHASSWPENDRQGYLFSLETYLTRFWMPILLAVVVLSIWYRIVTLPTLIFWVVVLSLAFQQNTVFEGRYRKVLECVAVVAFVDVIRLKQPFKRLIRLIRK